MNFCRLLDFIDRSLMSFSGLPRDSARAGSLEEPAFFPDGGRVRYSGSGWYMRVDEHIIIRAMSSTVNDFIGVIPNGALVVPLLCRGRRMVLYNVRIQFTNNHISFHLDISMAHREASGLAVISATNFVAFPNEGPAMFRGQLLLNFNSRRIGTWTRCAEMGKRRRKG